MSQRPTISETSATNQNLQSADRDYALNLVHRVCCLAGDPEFLARRRSGRCNSLASAIERHDSGRIFNWLVQTLSYQGIADRIAHDYMQRHGSARWARIKASLDRKPSCPKLRGYWPFYDCRYRKGSATCAEPRHIGACPLPRLPLRNGHLNQMAYSLFLFIRDVADGDFVGWIDAQLSSVNSKSVDRLAALLQAIIAPLRNVYGVSDKVLTMTLADLLLSADQQRPLWRQIGATMVVVDSLVHNFLHRTGILRRLGAEHPYGERCYRLGGCADILSLLAAEIDARQFNPSFPKSFPRFVQSAVWRYCAADGLDICNGNRINDDAACDNRHCQLFRHCDRVTLRAERKKVA
jgi:hypothetical protein